MRPDHGRAALADVAPWLAKTLARPSIITPPVFGIQDITVETVRVATRDGVQLATDLYLPPVVPAPAVLMRTPYGRALDTYVGVFLALARRGYVVVAQDCRGTGDSEPDVWNFYVNEPEDSYDLLEWVHRQPWSNGFIGSCGGSYIGQTQWQMAVHPRMSAILPEVSGLGVAPSSVHLYMFVNLYERLVGDGTVAAPSMTELERTFHDETLAGGLYNEPMEPALPASVLERFPELRGMDTVAAQRRLWARYCDMTGAERVELLTSAYGLEEVTMTAIESSTALFGQWTVNDSHTLPSTDIDRLAASLRAPALLRTGWYDWALNDALGTWSLIAGSAEDHVRNGSRLLIAPSAHNMPGYHEGIETHPELLHAYSTPTAVELLLQWLRTVDEDAFDAWPTVVYYLMGANRWEAASAWPVPGSRTLAMYLREDGRLAPEPPGETSGTDRYAYDPADPTPTVGGSIVSYLYPPGSVDVAEVQQRPDLLVYTGDVLDQDLDVVGPLSFVLYASSSAIDTDFAVRLSDVFPDGRAIQIQSGILRARYREGLDRPMALTPHECSRFEIDMWATANRFRAGHRIRIDISSADFPRFDRNSNLGGEPGSSVVAEHTVWRDADHPSHVLLPIAPDLDSR